MERLLTPPSFPQSINVFFQTEPKKYILKPPQISKSHFSRSLSPQKVMMRRRFPKLPHEDLTEPPKKSKRFNSPTEGYNSKKRQLKSFKREIFKPANIREAREFTERKYVLTHDGTTYTAKHEKDHADFLDSKAKRLAGSFVPSFKGKNLETPKGYINSYNTFETFKANI